MEDKIVSHEWRMAASDADTQSYRYKRITFENPKQGNVQTAIEPICQQAIKVIDEKRRRTKKREPLFDIFLNEKDVMDALTSMRYLHGKPLFLRPGPFDPYEKYPIHIGPTERKLLSLGTYSICCDACDSHCTSNTISHRWPTRHEIHSERRVVQPCTR
jgi:hypothetical protein